MENTINDYLQFTRDSEARACWLRVNSGEVAYTTVAGDQCLVDLDKDGRVLTIELLGPSAEVTMAKKQMLMIDLETSTSSYKSPMSLGSKQEEGTRRIESTNFEAVGS